jgi:predicted ATPase
VAIHVRATDAPHEVNLADAGFGYSQMLPLIALMWSAHQRSARAHRAGEQVLVAMEQPELHLHPAHQARLADMFASVAVASGGRVRLMIETHSEAMVNRFGELIGEGRIGADQVQLAVFEHEESRQITRVRFAGYNADGSLTADWPFGFFAP